MASSKTDASSLEIVIFTLSAASPISSPNLSDYVSFLSVDRETGRSLSQEIDDGMNILLKGFFVASIAAFEL